MNEIIKIQTSRGGKQIVSARELAAYLGITTDFTTWCKRMFEYGFTENQDYAFLKIGEPDSQGIANPNPKADYALTLDCAKEISMLQRTDKGKAARQYFIEIEKKHNLTSHNLPVTYAEALRQLASKVEETEKMQRQLEEQRPSVEFYKAVADSSDTLDMLAVSKVLGIGRTKLFQFLRDQKITIPDTNNLPYQRYISEGYFKTIEQPYIGSEGKTHINIKVLVYQKGVDFIQKRLKKFDKN